MPNGFSVQRKGVVSDISLPSVADITAVGEADLDNALPWDYIKPARFFVEMTLKKPFIDTLKTQSESRRIRLEEFDFLRERIDWYRDRDEQNTISLNLEERRRMMDEDQEFIDAMEDRQRALAELNFDSSEIKLDAVLAEEAENAEEEETSPDLSQSDSAPTDSDSELASNNDLTVDQETDAEAVNDTDEEDEEPVPEFDIQLREALRIMVNAAEASPNTNDWKQPALPLASSKSRFNKLLN